MQKLEYCAVKGIGGGLTDYSLLIYYRQDGMEKQVLFKRAAKKLGHKNEQDYVSHIIHKLGMAGS